MVIKKLILHNFGIYADTKEFIFDGNKNVILIGGMNGRGKTTILEAVLLALYGRDSFAYSESEFNSYSRYLDSYVNKADGTFMTYIQLEFVLDDVYYTIKRSWEGGKKKIIDSIEVFQEGTQNSFITEKNWAVFMESLLPSRLSSFFFFDGEKIAELAADSTDEKLKESIKSLLGIEVLENLDRNLNKLLQKVSKEKGNDFTEEVSFQLRRDKEEAEQRLADIDQKINAVKEQIIKKEKMIEQAHTEYSSKGGDIFDKKAQYMEDRKSLLIEQSQEKDLLLEIASSELPLKLVSDLLEDIRSDVEREREYKENQMAVKKIREFYDSYKKEKSSKELRDFISYMSSVADDGNTETLYGMSDAGWLQLVQLLDGKLEKKIYDTNELFAKRDETLRKIENVEGMLSVELDEEKISKIYKKIIRLEHERSKLEVELEELENERPHINNSVIKASSAFNSYVEGMLKKLEITDDFDRMVKYSHLAMDVLSEYKVRLQGRKIGRLADTMTDCYKQLANKKGMIDQIKMNPVSLELSYLNEDGEEVPKERLSAGEKQLMVVSLLWALAKCSKRKLPVIIDTPLSRLDSKHRMSLIETYFPNASDQTIVLSTDSEIYGRYYKALKKNVGNEYTLDYNDETKSTTILKGYRWEEEI